MILCDKQLLEYNENLIKPFSTEAVQSIAYDLQTESFANEPGKEKTNILLQPGESIFVKAKEEIHLPANLIGNVILRNSRIRQGLLLTAPVYYPGHHTKVFFRITNVSKQSITLDQQTGIASIMFERLETEAEHPYEGSFQKEFEFKGMGTYSSILSDEMSDIEKKVNDIKDIEKSIYGNVLAIMAVFIGIFSIININLQNASLDMKNLISLDLTTAGSVGFLVAIINMILPGGKHKKFVWIACSIAFIMAIILQYIK